MQGKNKLGVSQDTCIELVLNYEENLVIQGKEIIFYLKQQIKNGGDNLKSPAAPPRLLDPPRLISERKSRPGRRSKVSAPRRNERETCESFDITFGRIRYGVPYQISGNCDSRGLDSERSPSAGLRVCRCSFISFCRAFTVLDITIDDCFIPSFVLRSRRCYGVNNQRQRSAVDGFRQRASRESYGDKAIGYVQLRRKNGICIVKGRVCPEHRVRSKAYSVTLTINEKLRKVNDIECHDCAASAAGKCDDTSNKQKSQCRLTTLFLSGVKSPFDDLLLIYGSHGRIM
ncbi:hypothetical protein EVAR_47449_1 [Eumeta japonica]|uniref:Uncharacterized protein n=1 Tax=Eumeta variegata TaxID=151549 RepID=A0A4C1XA71_EUMVA|nr:hypothetical protein EVAR_47449_1 [Eumeta japonica]